MIVIARSERIVLRTLTVDDADDLLTVLGDPEVMRFGTTGTATRADCVAFIETNAEVEHRTGVGAWAVCTPDDATLLGYCRLRREADWIGADEIEIGYRLATRAWGKGYATEAARLARDLAFDELDAPTLIALIDPANEPSARVAERIGMRPTREIMLPEYDHPDLVYTMTAADRPPVSR